MAEPSELPLPAGTRCPQCDYEFGVPDATTCSECGLAIGHVVRQIIRDRATWRRRPFVNALVFHLAAAVVFSFAVEVSAAFQAGLRLDGEFRSALIASCAAAVGASLLLGFLAAAIARRGERLLWADLWARTHLIMFAPWLLMPISCALPLRNPIVWHIGLWTSLAACIACGVAAMIVRFQRRRRLMLTAPLPAAAITVLYILQLITVIATAAYMPYIAFKISSILGV